MQLIDSVGISLRERAFRANLQHMLLRHLKVRGRMHRILGLLALFVVVAVAHSAAASERRLALVIGNGSYLATTVTSAVNDAALIAQTLQTSGFEVTSLQDLNEAGLRQSFRDFLIKIKSSGPDTVVAVYFAGLGLQCEGENYLLPVDANISQASDPVRHALPLSDQMHSLAALHVKASLLMVDAARPSPFLLSGRPPASGLAWTEAEANMLIAFNATPGTVAPDSADGHGAYAAALAEKMLQDGLAFERLFDQVRLRVNELTNGAEVPWDASNIQTGWAFSRRAGTSKPAASADRITWMRSQPMRKLSPDDAYWVAVLRDTFDAYAEFLAEYWNDPMAGRVEALLATRREAITWRRSRQANVADAYWTYLERYPHGPHAADAERLLTHLGAAITPPQKFGRLDYDVPPPLPAELEFTDRPVLRLDDPALAFAPLKPLPSYFLETPPSQPQALTQTAARPRDNDVPSRPLVSSPTDVGLPTPPALPEQVAIGATSPPSGRATTDAPGRGEGQGGSLAPSGATGAGIDSASTSNVQSSPSVSLTAFPGSMGLAPLQSSPLDQAKASPGGSLPAWASILPTGGKTLGAPAPAPSKGVGEPLFVSAALAPVSSPAARNVGSTPAGARPAPHQAPPGAPLARLSPHSAQPLTTGSIAPPNSSSIAPPGGRTGSIPSPVHPASTGNIAPSGSRPTTQQGTGGEERSSHPPSQPTQSTPRPDARAAGLAPRAVHLPTPAAGSASTAADQGAKHVARTRKPEPPMALAPNAEVSPEASARPSDKNPCTVANGRLSCDEPR